MATRYLAECAGWCHCFRDATPFAPLPTIELSHSDLIDTDFVNPLRLGTAAPRWDYAYVCLPGRGIENAKGWPLARECVRALSRAGFSGVLIGRSPIRDLPSVRHVSVMPRLRWEPFLRTLAASRCLLVAGVEDASPRTIAEALALDRPAVVNRNILGGWKYISESTGAFFTSELDVVEVVASVLAHSTNAREWYSDCFGLRRAGARLKHFLNDLGANVRAPYVTLGHVPASDAFLGGAPGACARKALPRSRAR